MADEILNTGPGEEITPADPETVTGEPTKAAEPAAPPPLIDEGRWVYRTSARPKWYREYPSWRVCDLQTGS